MGVVLHIDTRETDKTLMWLKIDKKTVSLSGKNKLLKSQILLTLIEKLLKKQKLTIWDIGAIRVNVGPGSFTGLRVGVAVANALGWALGIPVNGQDVRKKPVEPRVWFWVNRV